MFHYAVFLISNQPLSHSQLQTEGGEKRKVPIGIGEHTFVRKAIIDKNARIGKNVKVHTLLCSCNSMFHKP